MDKPEDGPGRDVYGASSGEGRPSPLDGGGDPDADDRFGDDPGFAEPSVSVVAPSAIRDEDRLLLVFAYLGPLCLVPLFSTRDPFVKWHARQGTALLIGLMLAIAALSPFHWFFSMIPLLGRLFHAAEVFVGLGYLAIIAMCIERALAGGRYRVPWLADLADTV